MDNIIRNIIEKNKDKLVKITATGLISLMAASGFTSCDNMGFNTSTESQSEVTTELETNSTGENNTNKPNTPQYTVEHSETYLRAKAKWQGHWNKDGINLNVDSKQLAFQFKAAPFTFLEEQGAVYYSDGNVYAYGNEDFSNNDCIISKAFIDTSTPEHDMYLLVQYISDEVSKLTSNNNGAHVTTWMLKYTLDKDVYKDLLLFMGDYRIGFLIQQIDVEYEPEIISKTTIKYDLINYLKLFDKTEILNTSPCGSNYISHINYDDMSITVNHSTREAPGKIYSYKVYLKETPTWGKVLVGSQFRDPISKEERDSLTVDDLMPIRDTFMGNALWDFSVNGWMCGPSDEQKAQSQLQYLLDYVEINGSGREYNIDKYEQGLIPYKYVNNLTSNYEYSKEYDK